MAAVWYRPRLTRRRAIAAAVLAVGGVVFLLLPAGQKLRSRIEWSAEDTRGGARLWLWQDSIRMAGDQWLVGTGLETFGNEYPRYQSVELAKAYPDWYHESPHNVFLDVLASQGVLGLAGLLGLAAIPLAAAWLRRTEAPGETGVGRGSSGGRLDQPTVSGLYRADRTLLLRDGGLGDDARCCLRDRAERCFRTSLAVGHDPAGRPVGWFRRTSLGWRTGTWQRFAPE